MAPPPAPHLLALARQWVTFLNHGRWGDAVGCLHAAATVNGLTGVDARVQLSLALVGLPAHLSPLCTRAN